MELGIKLAQTQALSPQMELSVRILQMDSAQLNDYLKEVMLENPVIEIEPPKAADDKKDLALRKMEWLENQTIREKENVGYYEEDEGSILEKTVSVTDGQSLVDHLLSQVELSDIPVQLACAARYVIGFLDENGYLTAQQGEMEKDGKYPSALLCKAVQLIQSFDPAGVGAHDLRECLLLQLGPEQVLERQIVSQMLEEVAKNRVQAIAKALDQPVEQVQAAIRQIQSLNPKPGALYESGQAPQYITPDVVVTNFGDRYNVMLCEFGYPEIHLSPSYLQMAKETSDQEVLDYINQKVNQVNWIKKCIENRNKTLLAVSKAIVKRQERFFRYGPQYLNILRMREVGEMVGLHESTVSRAVRDKYLQCAHGVFPLRHFFVKGIEKEGESGASAYSIKCRLRELVDGEDKASPLSDQRLSELLGQEGMSISRRTVAKYREELGIAKSCERLK